MRSDTYQRVFEVADQLLAEGVRPTQQNVRQRIGKGSVSTIHKALADWWQSIGQRLTKSQQYPDLPEPLVQAMTDWWQQAVDRSGREFEGRYDQQARQLKKLQAAHEQQQQKAQQQLSEALKQQSELLQQLHQTQQQLQERTSEELHLGQRVVKAETEQQRLQQELQVQEQVILRLENERDRLHQQLRKTGISEQHEQLKQENDNLRKLIDKLDRKCLKLEQQLAVNTD